MSNGISGYNPGSLSPYRSVDPRTETGATLRGEATPSNPERLSSVRPELGPELSEDEARMIDRHFPETERMKLRLYGPGRTAESVDPGSRGRRLDLRG